MILSECITPEENDGGAAIFLTFIIGVLCAIYGTAVTLSAGLTELQNYTWYVFAFFFFALSRLTQAYINNPKKIPLWSVVAPHVLSALGIFIFLAVAAVIAVYNGGEDEKGLDYLIVLGTKPNVESTGSEVTYRLDKAIEYAYENPSVKIVISGGLIYKDRQEAVIMADYLVEHGINPDMILLELESVNTRENLIYSKALIEKHIADMQQNTDITIITKYGPVLVAENRPKKIGILTNDFHMYRAMQTAKALGFKEVYPVSTASNRLLYVHMVMRETFAILKYKFLGYM